MIVAPSENEGSLFVKVVDKNCDSVDVSASSKTVSTNCTMITSDEGVVSASVTQGYEVRKRRPKFAAESDLYSEVTFREDCTQFPVELS